MVRSTAQRWPAMIVLVGLAWLVGNAAAADVQPFRLSEAVPADVMAVMQWRDHDGRKFVREQYARVWAAVERQGFERDLKRLLRTDVERRQGDLTAFDLMWDELAERATRVRWAELWAREGALAMKVGFPTGLEALGLFLPAPDKTTDAFEPLENLFKGLVKLLPEGQLELRSEGEGRRVVHRLLVANMVPPLSLTLARHDEVILLGINTALVEQSLALLRGESPAEAASVKSSARITGALEKLPSATDSYTFVDVARMMQELRQFATITAQAFEPLPRDGGSDAPATQPVNPLGFLPKLVDAVDVWEYTASVQSTDGMKTTAESVTLLRAAAREKPLFQALYSNPVLKEPLKMIPQQATSMYVTNGIGVQVAYDWLIDFVQREVPEGAAMIAEMRAQQDLLGFNLEKLLLGWPSGSFATFSANLRSRSSTDSVWMLGVRDAEAARAALDFAMNQLAPIMEQQRGSIEDHRIGEDAEFKLLILPMMMSAMLGQPTLGVFQDQMIVGNSPHAVEAVVKAARGEQPNFAENEQFKTDGLPLRGPVTAVQFKNLTRYGEELSTMLSLPTLAQMALPAQVAREPMVVTGFSLLVKAANVARELNFYRSSAAVTTQEELISRTQSVTHYQEPPAPRTRTRPTTEPSPTEPTTEPAAEPETGGNGTQ